MKAIKFLVLLVVLSLFWGLPVWAWDINELPPGFTVAEPWVPVELDGKTLFHVRISTKTESASQIADRLSERIKKLAQDPTFNPQSITVRDTPLGSDVMAGDQVIVPVWAFAAKVEALFCALVWLFWGAGAAMANIAPDLGAQEFVEVETLEEPKPKDHLRLSGEHLSRGYAWMKCPPGLQRAVEAYKVSPSVQIAVRK